MSDHRCVIACADFAIRLTRDRAVDERVMRGNIVEPPADVALAQVAPRRPPREQAIVVGIDVSADVDEPVREQPIDQRALWRCSRYGHKPAETQRYGYENRPAYMDTRTIPNGAANPDARAHPHTPADRYSLAQPDAHALESVS